MNILENLSMLMGGNMEVGIIAVGATVIVVTAFFLIKSTSRKGAGQRRESSAGNAETEAAPKKRGLIPWKRNAPANAQSNAEEATIPSPDSSDSNSEVDNSTLQVNEAGDMEVPGTDSPDTVPEETSESTQEQPTEEGAGEQNKAPENAPQKEPSIGGGAFDLFKEEIIEDSNVGRFAAALDDVDAHDLLDEAHNLMNLFGRNRK